jgi:hypothetical protein
MPTIFDGETRAALQERITRLSPDARATFGRLTAPQMVCHVSAPLRQGLGELDAGTPSGAFSVFPVNLLMIHVVPWPKEKGKSPPEFLATAPTTWDADVATLRDLIERFAARGPEAPWPASKVFGTISGSTWGVLQHEHLNHHLGQFGV